MPWDDLTKYVIIHYGNLMTPLEFQGYRSVMGQEKMAVVNSAAIRARLQKMFVSEDPEVVAMLANGSDAFLIGVRERILREHSDSVFLNYCPRCGALTRTPRAKLCLKCYHEWREK